MKQNCPSFQWLLLCITLLAGCTTVQDFQNMTADQRANAVCQRQRGLQDLYQQKQGLESRVSDAQAALTRGYRIHTQCQQVKVYGNATTTCSTMGNYTDCQTFRPESYETKCTETPVSLNFELEKSNVGSWQRAIESLDARLKSEWQRCYQSIYNLPPEEAFKYY